jgi:hypothetical protein
MLQTTLTNAGLDIGKVNEMLAQDQRDKRDAFRRQMKNADFSGAASAYRQAIETRFKAINGLPRVPYQHVTLDEPFLIWQVPRLENGTFVSAHIEPLNNWVKVNLNKFGGADDTQFVFYFLWQNTSNGPVIINAASSLALGGHCEVDAAPGFFSGDQAALSLSVLLGTMRWSGWGTDPETGQSNDQTYYPYDGFSVYQSIAQLSANGGSYLPLGSGQDIQTQAFYFNSFDLHQNQILVPAGAVAVFEVAFTMQYGFREGENIEDLIAVDFSTGSNAVICPAVSLELLGPD